MKTIDKILGTVPRIIAGGIVAIALPFLIRSCSINQSNHPYMQGEYKRAKYSFANNGLIGHTYTIIAQDGTKLRCDDLGVNFRYNYDQEIIDSVIVYDKDNKITKIYKNNLGKKDKNDEFLHNLTAQVKEAEVVISTRIETQSQMETLDRNIHLKEDQSNLLKKIGG
ncbi:hypothetical protein HYT57_01810 [Candidatus Woesearchaeota archaeon]|nr:hypothetical protein [Candidatus Woesearchaeota archaeon]